MIALYEAGATLHEVARAAKVTYYFARKIIGGASATRTPTEAGRLASSNGRLGSSVKRAPMPETTKKRLSESRLRWAEEHAAGVSLKPNGYLEYTRGPHKGKSVHRVVAEQMLGRPLDQREHVHHIDENKTNNDPSNLVVLSISEHVRLHRNNWRYAC